MPAATVLPHNFRTFMAETDGHEGLSPAKGAPPKPTEDIPRGVGFTGFGPYTA